MTQQSGVTSIWAAIVPSIATIASFIIVWIQRRNLLEAARPELVLDGWTRGIIQGSTHAIDTIKIETVRNVGKGAATNVFLNITEGSQVNGFPTASMSTIQLPIIAPNEKEAIDAQIFLHWGNVPAPDGWPYFSFTISIFCWDARSVRHETRYSMLAGRLDMAALIFGGTQVAPSLSLSTRQTLSKAVWALKISERFSRALKPPFLMKLLQRARGRVRKA